MKKLYHFKWDCYRQGEVEGLFVEDEETITKNIGKDVIFGEILGKHSDVFGTLGMEDLEVIDVSESFINEFQEKIGSFGYNPIEYIEDEV